jgi:UDP-N-acetylglucosamine diphosphorylase / glucose-1-phosphate thymidylyltransferase / UDP-N-acetylgalactosamine diphosphorylase / glucosamine-1-phosphate N-acetyltransferase / galactosamine-1-phosphate N-acetyltransferase
VMIGERAFIGANSVLQGPCSIGTHARLAPLTVIRGGSTIGAVCKVGGEVSNSILFGYTNKAHEGFLGDSYIGKWVNLGAGTITSNLKNTYGPISVITPAGRHNTGKRFLGAMIGDHVKTAVGTRLLAGAYVGFASQVALSSFAPQMVRSFTFHTDRGPEPYRMDKATDVMRVVFSRRERLWTELDEALVHYVARTAGQVEGG